jgi:uncharacterized damage-inducible protein DinB
MNIEKTKAGRPRRYALEPPAGFVDIELAHQVAMLRELAERVCDQISDLPEEALDYTPGDTKLSISRLVLHLLWAETTWVRRISGLELPQTLADSIQPGGLEQFGEQPPTGYTAAGLIDLCRTTQNSYSEQALREVRDIDSVRKSDGSTYSVRGVMGQLVWHWTYHSGQIGLLRLLWGSDYQWRSEEIVALPPR